MEKLLSLFKKKELKNFKVAIRTEPGRVVAGYVKTTAMPAEGSVVFAQTYRGNECGVVLDARAA